MLFDHCAACQRCCVVDPGNPPLEVSLTATEATRIGSLCIETSCENLGPSGCEMKDDKPFSCRLYPLSFDPKSRRFSYDSECPIMTTYVEQLHDRDSEASRHLLSIESEILKLEKSDPDFLVRNHEVDVDYFDLIKLPLNSSLQGNIK
jgi:hypothetical protein